MKKKLVSIIALSLAGLMIFSGCESKEEKEAKIVAEQKQVASTQEVNQNDYRGGYMRFQAIKNKVIEVVNNFNANQNKEIIQTNPSNYWNDGNFQYFANDFLVSSCFDYTQYFNELETTWEDVPPAVEALLMNPDGEYYNKDMIDHSCIKNSTNNYTLKYEQNTHPYYIESNSLALYTIYDVNCTFDQNNDWLQMNKMATIDEILDYPINEELIEYGRQKNTNSFVIQTAKERLYITYETLEGTEENEYNPLQNAKITSFAYSKLSGKKLPYYVEKEIEVMEEGVLMDEIKTEGVDEEGNVVYQYNLRDSIFPHFNDITADWVLEFPIEEGYYDNYIVFDGKDMTIYNQNHMSNQMEIIEFHSDGTIQDKTLSLVETLTPFTLNWVSENGKQTGSIDLFVNENRDLTNENGEILIPGEKALYNSEGRVIVSNEFLEKMGLLDPDTVVEEPSEEGSEPKEEVKDDTEKKSEEKSDKK